MSVSALRNHSRRASLLVHPEPGLREGHRGSARAVARARPAVGAQVGAEKILGEDRIPDAAHRNRAVSALLLDIRDSRARRT